MSNKQRFEFEIWQDNAVVATVSGYNRKQVRREAMHYAVVYGQDGLVRVCEKETS